jgi:hypothetical protein
MKEFFFLVPKGGNRVLEAQKPIFLGIYGMNLLEFLFTGELDTCPQNLIFTRCAEH